MSHVASWNPPSGLSPSSKPFSVIRRTNFLLFPRMAQIAPIGHLDQLNWWYQYSVLYSKIHLLRLLSSHSIVLSFRKLENEETKKNFMEFCFRTSIQSSEKKIFLFFLRFLWEMKLVPLLFPVFFYSVRNLYILGRAFIMLWWFVLVVGDRFPRHGYLHNLHNRWEYESEKTNKQTNEFWSEENHSQKLLFSILSPSLLQRSNSTSNNPDCVATFYWRHLILEEGRWWANSICMNWRDPGEGRQGEQRIKKDGSLAPEKKE